MNLEAIIYDDLKSINLLYQLPHIKPTSSIQAIMLSFWHIDKLSTTEQKLFLHYKPLYDYQPF